MAVQEHERPRERLLIRAAATRPIGEDLLVSAWGADGPIERLSGSGPHLWQSFRDGASVEEAADDVVSRTGRPVAQVEAEVRRFASELVAAELADWDPQ